MQSLRNLGRLFASHPLTRDAPLAAWSRFAAWQARSRLGGEIVVPWIGGTRLALRNGYAGATGNVYCGLYEFVDMMLPLHFLRAGDLFLDIGANVGSFTVLAAGVRRARTWSFEPDPVTLQRLERNIALNELGGLVTVHPVVLGAADGEVRFTAGRDATNRIAQAGDSETRALPQRRLDTVVGNDGPVMAKIDVEGAEEMVLSGAPATLQRESLRLVEIETVTPAVTAAMIEAGFEQVYYDPFRRSLQSEPAPDKSSNSIFARDLAFVRERLASAPAVEVLGRSI